MFNDTYLKANNLNALTKSNKSVLSEGKSLILVSL